MNAAAAVACSASSSSGCSGAISVWCAMKSSGTAVAAADSSSSGGGLIGMLINAAITQALNHTLDASYKVAATTSYRLLSAGQPGGILYGPRSPKYQSD